MKSVLAAFRFLTVFPIPVKSPLKRISFVHSVRWFPLVGVALAALLSLAYLVGKLKFSDATVCFILVVLLAVFTRGLHLVGLSASFEALLSGRTRQGMLRIMKDPHSGALGTTALIFVLLAKFFLLDEIYEYLKIPALFLVLAGSRSGMSLLLGNLPYLRGREGLGYAFRKGLTVKDWAVALGLGILVALITFQWIGLLVYFLGIVSLWLFGLYVKRKLGGITGDILGAANEIGEVLFLFWLRVFLN